ncbi:hypothetical protein GOODEAATRI_006419 [Goodea atripinnis]|uniref:Uncharacterized protein n=1 Tax=Goodea atripinnis TaxID=208336 RepID=A0ABV0MZ45_9TELE
MDKTFWGSKQALALLGYKRGQNCSSLPPPSPASAPASADLADVSCRPTSSSFCRRRHRHLLSISERSVPSLGTLIHKEPWRSHGEHRRNPRRSPDLRWVPEDMWWGLEDLWMGPEDMRWNFCRGSGHRGDSSSNRCGSGAREDGNGSDDDDGWKEEAETSG